MTQTSSSSPPCLASPLSGDALQRHARRAGVSARLSSQSDSGAAHE